MDVLDDLYHRTAFHISADKLILIIQSLTAKKQDEIEYFKDKIARYEQKRRKEEAAYQSLSPLRRLFTGRPPSHHQAVEYMVYVKEPFKKIEKVKREIQDLKRVLERIQQNPASREIVLSHRLIDELASWVESEEISNEY